MVEEGEVEGRIVCLENEAKSIEPEVAVIQHYGLEPKIVSRPRALGNFLEGTKAIDPRTIKAFVLDMHMPKINNLSEINLPAADTLDGEAVGLAVAEQYLRRPESKFRQTPLAFLTGFSIDAPVLNRIKALRRQGNNIVVLKKHDDLPQFDEFIKSVIEEKKSKYSDLPEKISDYKEGIDIALEILTDLGIQDAEKIALLGYDAEDNVRIEGIVRRIKDKLSIDIQDRVALIIDIKSCLDAVFGIDDTRQRKWLSKRQKILERKSPLQILKEGHQHGLAQIAALLRQITG